MGLVSKEKMLEKLGQFHPDYMFNIASIKNFIKEEPEVNETGHKEGKWIFVNGALIKATCSVCGYNAKWSHEYDPMEMNYCPNCGSDMRSKYAPLADDDGIYG